MPTPVSSGSLRDDCVELVVRVAVFPPLVFPFYFFSPFISS